MALISCQALLESPEPKDPQDGEVAKMMLQQPEEHLQKARQWAVRYAGAPDEPMDMTPFLQAMGVGKTKGQADMYVCNRRQGSVSTSTKANVHVEAIKDFPSRWSTSSWTWASKPVRSSRHSESLAFTRTEVNHTLQDMDGSST